MSKIIDHTYTLYNNSFILTPLIIEFYKNYEGQINDLLLAYLVLPLVLHEDTKASLQNIRSTSSIHTFGRKKENFYGLPQRIQDYKELTNKCVQNAIDNNYIFIDENLKVNVIREYKNPELSLIESMKASGNIVKILRQLDVVAIFRLLGVKKL